MHLFIPNEQIHRRITRQVNDLYVKKCRTNLATQHIQNNGPLIWNKLPTGIKLQTHVSVKQFSYRLSKKFIQQYMTV